MAFLLKKLEPTFSESLMELIEKKGRMPAEIYTKAGVTKGIYSVDSINEQLCFRATSRLQTGESPRMSNPGQLKKFQGCLLGNLLTVGPYYTKAKPHKIRRISQACGSSARPRFKGEVVELTKDLDATLAALKQGMLSVNA